MVAAPDIEQSVQVSLDQIAILNSTRKARDGSFSMTGYKGLTLSRGSSGR